MNLKLRPTRSRPILKGIARSNRVRLRLCLFERAACALSAIGTSGHAFSRTSCPLSGLKRTSHGPVATSTREAAPRRLPQLRQEGAPQFPPGGNAHPQAAGRSPVQNRQFNLRCPRGNGHCAVARYRRKFIPPTASGGAAMSNVVDLFHTTAFDPETVKVLCDAYDRACQSMHDTGQPYIVSEIIALNIIALAKAGERNPDRLCEGALKALPNKAVFETKSRR
jgi:hypothetical protein